MSNITTAPGLVSIDPIQGLVNYVKDIKPFHTKIFQVLFEYVYMDRVNTTIVDTMQMFIDDNQTYITNVMDPSLQNPGGIPANSFWYNTTNSTLYLRGNYLNPLLVIGTNTMKLAGDYTKLFTIGFTFNISGTGTVNDGDYIVSSITFDGISTIIDTLANPINGMPGTNSFISVGLNTGTFYWNGHQLFIVNGSNQTLIPNVIVATSAPPYGSLSAYWFNPVSNLLYSWNGTSYIPAILFSGIVGYWIQFLSQLGANPNPTTSVDTSVTEFMETIAFNWSGNYSYLITDISQLSSNKVGIAGNLSNAIMAYDITEINSLVSFVTEVMHDPSTNITLITMDTVPGVVNIGDTLIVQDIDITFWYEWPIINANPLPTQPSQSSSIAGIGQPVYMPPSVPMAVQFSPQQSTNALVLSINSNVVVPTITVFGNATTSVQVGALFKINGSNTNDGVYYAVYVQYEPISNTTTIGVAATNGVSAPILIATGGGMVIPYRFVAEVPQGSFDIAYDSGPFDKSAGSLIYQGP